jgi:hypothetical protein
MSDEMVTWSDNLANYIALVERQWARWYALFEPDHYEYPIPGEPLIRTPVYKPGRYVFKDAAPVSHDAKPTADRGAA